MKLGIPYRSAALVCAAFYLLAGPPGQGGRVLCVAENGRTEVEFARAGRCIEAVERDAASGGAHVDFVTIEHENSRCGRCVDIPIAAAADQAKPPSRVSASEVSLHARSDLSVAGTAGLSRYTRLRLDLFRRDGRDPVIHSLRTVTLLI